MSSDESSGKASLSSPIPSPSSSVSRPSCRPSPSVSTSLSVPVTETSPIVAEANTVSDPLMLWLIVAMVSAPSSSVSAMSTQMYWGMSQLTFVNLMYEGSTVTTELSEEGVMTSVPSGASSNDTSYQLEPPSSRVRLVTSVEIDAPIALASSRSSTASGAIGTIAAAIITATISSVLAVCVAFSMLSVLLSIFLVVRWLVVLLEVEVLELLSVVLGLVLCCLSSVSVQL